MKDDSTASTFESGAGNAALRQSKSANGVAWIVKPKLDLPSPKHRVVAIAEEATRACSAEDIRQAESKNSEREESKRGMHPRGKGERRGAVAGAWIGSSPGGRGVAQKYPKRHGDQGIGGKAEMTSLTEWTNGRQGSPVPTI